jgi:phage shock protein E
MNTTTLLIVAAVVVLFLLIQRSQGGGGNVDDMKDLVASGAKLVDVRTPGEFAAGHLDGAVNIPLDLLAQRFKDLGPKDGKIVLYCRSGARSGRAKAMLEQQGFEHVFNLGAMSRW